MGTGYRDLGYGHVRFTWCNKKRRFINLNMNDIENLEIQSPDSVSEHLERLTTLFPNRLAKNADGKVVDFDTLWQKLSDTLVKGDKERIRRAGKKITEEKKEVVRIAYNSLYTRVDSNIDKSFAKSIAKDAPSCFLFRDNGFKDDTAKTNVLQLSWQLSLGMEMKMI
jgi:hypothetical protein